MRTELPIEQMTVEEKLKAMEALWDALCRREQDIPVPQWQKDLLDERQKLIREGKAKFVKWESAKKSIEERTK